MSTESHPTALTETAVLDQLRNVIDPELGCNIVDLGFIYNVHIDGGSISIAMTFTTQGCPMHDSLSYGAQAALMELPGVEDVHIEIVFEPPWTPEMMSPEAKARLGVRS